MFSPGTAGRGTKTKAPWWNSFFQFRRTPVTTDNKDKIKGRTATRRSCSGYWHIVNIFNNSVVCDLFVIWWPIWISVKQVSDFPDLLGFTFLCFVHFFKKNKCIVSRIFLQFFYIDVYAIQLVTLPIKQEKSAKGRSQQKYLIGKKTMKSITETHSKQEKQKRKKYIKKFKKGG